MGSYATFTNNQGVYSFSIYLDQLCAGPSLLNVNAVANQCAQVIGIPVLGMHRLC
jgi:hypothetical protein